jgi:DNA-binding transcriptional regulator/RsmH inhibitor MraZ
MTRKHQQPGAFFGQHETRLLEDGRIVLPVEVVRQLRDIEADNIWLGLIPNRPVLVICPGTQWDTWLRDLRCQFPFLNTPDGYMAFVSPSKLCEIDGQGRIYVSAMLRRHLGNNPGPNVVVVGAKDHFEIWTLSAFDDMVQKCREAVLRTSMNETKSLKQGKSQEDKVALVLSEEHDRTETKPPLPPAQPNFLQDTPLFSIKHRRSPDAQGSSASHHKGVVKKRLVSRAAKQNRKSESQAE